MQILSSLVAAGDNLTVKIAFIRVFMATTALLMLLIFTHQDRLLKVLEDRARFQTTTEFLVIQQAKYQAVSKERVTMAYMQTKADIVAVFEYSPQYVNDFSSIVEFEGRVLLNKKDWHNTVINKRSAMYQAHLTGRPYSFIIPKGIKSEDMFASQASIESLLITHSLEYSFSCPIFNLDNHYSGHMTLAWVSKPYRTDEQKYALEVNLEDTCTQHARAIGRTK